MASGKPAVDTEFLVRSWLENPPLFCRMVLPHWFPKAMSWVHRGLLAILLRQTDFLTEFGEETWPDETYYYGPEDLALIIEHFVWKPSAEHPPVSLFRLDADGKLHLMVSRFVEIMIPRGFGKTTVVNAANLLKILYKLRKFLVYLSETGNHAAEQLGNVKRELETNEKIHAVFGNIRPDRSDPQKWREDYIETLTGVVVMAEGRGGQVRGKNIGGQRPDDITIDDVEDKESVATEAQRHKTMVWLMGDVKPALPQVGENGGITVVGTLLHSEGMMVKLAKDPEWICITLGATDNYGNPIWAHYKTLQQIETLKLSYARQGLLNIFYMEYMSKHTHGEHSKFPAVFQYEIMKRAEFAAVSLCIDPAISESIEADYCAFGVVGMTNRGRLHVLYCDGAQGMHPREQIDEYFRLHFLWDPTYHGVEAVAFQKALVHLLREEMFRAAKNFGIRAYFEITPITHGKTGKVERVEGMLAPRYRAGYITHQDRFALLESQLIGWPDEKRDMPDVVAQCVSLLDPVAGLVYNPEMTEEEIALGTDPLSKDVYEPFKWKRAAP